MAQLEQVPLLSRKKGLAVVEAVLVMIVIVLIVQMWLLTSTLESYLAGHQEVVLPAVAVSGLLFGLNLSLLLLLRGLYRKAR
ncbi:MAG: hypothetical protein JNN08_12280 [Bryobacterales bacterium]|jgi:hypothetical protein|nr:hypothetical protein [Bryobacterales bacterium]